MLGNTFVDMLEERTGLEEEEVTPAAVMKTSIRKEL